ncbi:MAG: hypothetical protein JWN48_1423 [Myxococcaceae bacterium]|nr:hypothetical protein [Myxococcaceae bacterium]
MSSLSQDSENPHNAQAVLPEADSLAPLRVYVHLARGFDAVRWQQRWESGALIGINERMPYGYYRASSMGCDVVHSADAPEGLLGKLGRLGLRAVTGFDLVHAWRNRQKWADADVIWTHTESQHLAVLAVQQILRAKHRPAIIAQCVWLFDAPPAAWSPRGVVVRWLLRQADLITTLSPENLLVARKMFPGVRTEAVAFGITTDHMEPARTRPLSQPLRVLAVGNDRHRDWQTLVRAVAGDARVTLRIVSQTAPARLALGRSNVEIVRPTKNGELDALYEWADLAAVPLKPNLHASGITAIQEAIVRGLPVLTSDTGGLRSYFDDSELFYARSGDVASVREQLARFVREWPHCTERTRHAQQKMTVGPLSSIEYVRWHATRSRELVRPC